MYKDDSAGPILECEVDHDFLTIMGVHAHGVEYFGVLCEESPAPMVSREVVVPLIDVAVAPEAMEEDRPAEEPEGPVGDVEISVQVEMPEKVIIEDLELTATSSVHDLRRICKYFGIISLAVKERCMSG